MNLRRRANGFSLIEFMIAMAAGMVVIGALVVFTVSTGRGTSQNIRSEKVMQNLRNSLNLIEREIRRSGFDENAMRYVNACTDPSASSTCPMSQFGQVVVSPNPGSCAVVAYDNAASTSPGVVGAGKYHGFRRVLRLSDNIGVVQASLASATAPNCNAAWDDAAWLDVTDPKAIDVTALQFEIKTPLPASAASSVGGGCVTSNISTSNSLWLVVQDVNIVIVGQWADPSGMITKRSLQEHVRVKNDIVATAQPTVCS